MHFVCQGTLVLIASHAESQVISPHH